MSEKSNSKKKKVGFFVWIYRIFYYTSMFLVFFLLLFAILSQSSRFRSFALEKLTNQINSILIANIQIGDLKIKSSGAIELRNVKMITAGDTLAAVDEIFISIKYAPLLYNKLEINSIKLNNPNIKLLRNMQDSTWNTEKIAKPSDKEKKDSDGNFIVKINSLELIGGTFLRYDSLAAPLDEGIFDSNKMLLTDLEIKMKGMLELGDLDYSVNIKTIKTKEEFSGMEISNLRGKARLEEGKISVSGLEVVTKESNFRLNGAITNFNVLSPEGNQDFNKAKLKVTFRSDSIAFSDIHHFAPVPFTKFHKARNSEIIFSGDMGKLNISKFEFDILSNKINGNAILTNTTNPDDLTYKLDISDSELNPIEIAAILPEINLEALKQFKAIKIDKLEAIGTTSNATTEFIVYAGKSKISSNAKVDFSDEITYDANVNLRTFNLNDIMISPSYIYVEKLDLKAKGRGTDINNIRIQTNAEVYNAQYEEMKISKALLSVNTEENSVFNIDTLFLKFEDYYSEMEYMEGYSRKIGLSGLVDLSDKSTPKYEITSDFEGINLQYITDNDKMPYLISGKIDLSGEGAHPDSILGNLKMDVESAYFNKSALLPFSLEASIVKESPLNKIIELKSEFADIEFEGDFTFDNLQKSFEHQADVFKVFFEDKLKPFVPAGVLKEEIDSLQTYREPVAEFPQIDTKFRAKFKNIYPIVNLFADLDVQIDAEIEGTFFSHNINTIVEFDSLLVRSLYVSNAEGLNVKSNEMSSRGLLMIDLKDSVPVFNNFSLDFAAKDDIFINDLKISDPSLKFKIEEKKLSYEILTKLQDSLKVDFVGNLNFQSERLELISERLAIGFKNYQWQNRENIRVIYQDEVTDVKSFILQRKESEILSLKGTFKDTSDLDMNISLSNVPISEFIDFIPAESRDQLESLKGNINYVLINASNSLINPTITIDSKISNLNLNSIQLGNIESKLNIKNQIIQGNLELNDSTNKLIDISINNFFMDMGFERASGIDTTISIDAKIDSLPATTLSPFLVGFSRFSGHLNASAELRGENMENLKIKAKAELLDLGLVIDQTNLQYLTTGTVNIEDDLISLDNIVIRNAERDLQNGKAEVNGSLKLGKNGPEDFDIRVKSDRFKVLGNATQSTMPDLFGDLIISTNPGELVFSGDLDRPDFSGRVNVLRGDLKMRQIQAGSSTQTLLDYEVLAEGVKYTITTSTDTTENTKENTDDSEKANFADLMSLDLEIYIVNPVNVIMDIGPLGELFATIGSGNRQSIRYLKRTKQDAELFGDLRVLDNSRLKSFKILDASGNINFPTGDISNPTLDLVATYSGVTTQNDEQKNFVVTMLITGTAQNPKIEFSYLIENSQPIGDKQQIEEDALYLLITGNTKNQSSSLINYESGLQSGATYLSTGLLSSFLSGTGFIQSADIDFNEQWDPTLKLSGNVEGITWRWEGEFQNNQITVEVPFSSINTFKQDKFWRNFALQFSRATNTTELNRLNQNATNWEFKIRFGSKR